MEVENAGKKGLELKEGRNKEKKEMKGINRKGRGKTEIEEITEGKWRQENKENIQRKQELNGKRKQRKDKN